MINKGVTRRLAAILVADAVGYSRLMGTDDAGTLAQLKEIRDGVIAPVIAQIGGRIVKTTGDGLLAEFPSSVAAVEAAIEIQRRLAGERPAESEPIRFRIGLNVGEIILDGDDIYGDGVNVAARLEAMAEPGGICLSRRLHQDVRGKIDAEFRSLGRHQLKNIAEPVEVFAVGGAGGSGAPTRRRAIRLALAIAAMVLILGGGAWYWIAQWDASPQRPPNDIAIAHSASLAVLPLETISDNEDAALFARGLAADLNVALAKVPELRVISPSSPRRYAGSDLGLGKIAMELDVSHVLTGSVQEVSDRLRIAMSLVDTTGRTVWSDSFDGARSDVFALQDQIVYQVLVELQVAITMGEVARLMSRGTDNLEAWLLVIRARDEVFKYTRQGIAKGRELYEQAHAADPDWGNPVSGIAWTYREIIRRGWSKDVEADRKIAIEHAERAIALSPDDASGYITLGNILIDGGRYEEGIAMREKALEIAPTNFYVLAGLAFQLTFVGEEQRALSLYTRAREVSPHLPHWFLSAEGFTLHSAGEPERAIKRYRESLKLNDRADIHGRIAAAYADLGRTEDARGEVAITLEMDPEASVDKLMQIVRYRDPAKREWYAGLLRKAGLPE